MSTDAKVIFDSSGDVYLTEKDIFINTSQNVSLLAYDVEKANDEKYREQIYFQYFKGHRFDKKNHNWILFNEYLCFSFSFMTFVIRGKAQEDDDFTDENYMFDPIQYSFILNKRTCLTCDNFVAENYEKLLFVLQNME